MAAMLAGQSIGRFGAPADVSFQEKQPVTRLDDIVVLGTGTHSDARLYLSVKSFDVVHSGIVEFVADAWGLLLSDDFDEERDYVGFICGQKTDTPWNDLQELIHTVTLESSLERMDQRILIEGTFNQVDRDLYAAFACPSDVVQRGASSPWRLIRRLIAVHLDFRSAEYRAVAEVRSWLMTALSNADEDRVTDLYNAIAALVAKTRPTGGSLNWPRLQLALAPNFALALRPDASRDWDKLSAHTTERIGGVSDTVAGLTVPRKQAQADLGEGAGRPFIYLTGPSGCGKTALAKNWLEAGPGSSLWLDSRDIREGLVAFRARLSLRMTVADVLSLGSAPVRIVIDGLDRSMDESAHAAAAELARLAASSVGAVELLVTSQTLALDRVSLLISQSNGPPARTVAIGDLDDDDIALVLAERRELNAVLLQDQLRTVLRRPKLLDVVLRASSASNALSLEVQNEADVANLWWARLARGNGPDRTPRGEFLRGLAVWTAQNLTAELPAGHLVTAGLGNLVDVVDGLREDGVLGSDEDYFFNHDLFADWSRYRTFGTWTAASVEIAQRQELPTWHRAIVLYALKTLREGGVERWRLEHDELRANGHQTGADLYLDAILFAPDAESLVGALWSHFVSGDGDVLRRMLKRFAYVASVPDPRGALIAAGGNDGDGQLATYLAATWRQPTWVLWPPLIRVLAINSVDAVGAAPAEIAAIVDRWLRLTPPGYTARADAADLAVALGRSLSSQQRHSRLKDAEKTTIWEAFFAAGAEKPDIVTAATLEMLAHDDLDGLDIG